MILIMVYIKPKPIVKGKVPVEVQVRYVGGSNMTGWQLQLAASLAKKEGMAKYSVLQQQ